MIKDKELLNFLNCCEIAVIYLDHTGMIGYLTPTVTLITGILPEQIGKPIFETAFLRSKPELYRKITEQIALMNDNRIKSGNDHKLCDLICQKDYFEHIDDNKNIYQLMIHPYLSKHQEINGLLLVFYDITQRKNIENALEIEREKYRLLAGLTECALWEYNRDNKEVRYYHKLNSRNNLNSLTVPDYHNTVLKNGWVHPEDIPIFEAFCNSMDRGEDYLQYEFRFLEDNDDFIWMRFQGSALKDTNGEVHLIMGKTINIDKERRDLEKLLLKSEVDSLTGLNNRSTTKDKIEKCFSRSSAENLKDTHCFMIIDIDNFKQANDRFGHLFGDTLLETFSMLLSELFSSNDVIGRIGGDEFIVLLKSAKDKNQMIQTAQDICSMAKKYLSILKGDNVITVSVGMSLFPYDGMNYDTLYSKADTALYAAKARGKNQYAFYQPEMEAIQQFAVNERSRHRITGTVFDDEAPVIEKRLLSFAFDMLSESKSLDAAFHSIFQEIGKFYNLSRINIFESSLQNQVPRISYEWLNTGIPTMNYEFANQDPIIERYEELFTNNKIFYFDDISKIDVSPEMLHFYNSIGLKSVVQCAIYDSSKFIGTINFDDCSGTRQWNKSDLDTLSTLTKLISSFIIRLRSKQELNNEIFFTQAMLNNQKLSNYAIKEGTYELLYFNEYTENLFPNVKLGELCYKTIFERETPCESCPLKGLDEKNKRYSVEAYNEVKHSWYSTTASTVEMPNGQRMYLICASDVTSFIERVNSRDPLTGLLTLSKFEAEAMKLIACQDCNHYAILYSDFDKFKNINDEWGYSIGNEILIYFSNKISEYLHPDEIFCRITADKFALVLSYSDRKELLERINKYYIKIIREFKVKFPVINPVIISGLYFLTPEDKVLSIAMDKANLARKTVKGSHKSHIAIYDDSFHLKITKEKMIENHMYEALKNNEFIVYMQPKIDLHSLQITGAEALVRWKLPTGEYIGPMEFIPVFENNGFITELDFYVYEKTFRALRQWIDAGKQPIIVSVNVSRIHLNDSRFLERLDYLVEKYKIPTNLIELEITENIFFKELDRLIFIMNSLRKRGFLISIDDFGSGYSSLNLLKTLPIDILKLDREFFMQNEMRENDKIIISGIITLAKGLGLKVISEGVETIEQVKFLRDNSCDMAQGFLFYKPLPLDDFIDLID
jgi:diguanylate cyclase (GGDEF)-like protein